MEGSPALFCHSLIRAKSGEIPFRILDNYLAVLFILFIVSLQQYKQKRKM